MNGKKHEITESDMMRVENKLNSAMHDRLQNRTKDVTKTKIQNLHNFFDEMENEEESRTSSRNQSNVVISEAKDKDHLSTLSQTKGVITGLKVELNETKNNLEAVKKKLEDERATFKEKETDFINKLSMKEREFNSEIQVSGVSRRAVWPGSTRSSRSL
jgi:hypothetical protein